MKKLLLTLSALILLSGCGMTHQEKLNKQKECEELGLGHYLIQLPEEIICTNEYIPDKVFNCIEEYTDGIDEKYNNPDTVSNLREDDYSQVVKTCNEIFGDKVLINNQ